MTEVGQGERRERRALLVSIVATLVLSTLGVTWGVVTGSQMILFDGAYGFVGVLVSVVLLRAATLAQQAPSRRYPFGLQAATPLAIGVQGFVLLATLAYAAFEAVQTIQLGGSDVTPGWAIVYGVVTTLGSVATWRWLVGATGSSDLVASEALAWRVGALRGVGMIVGFSLMQLLSGTSWDGAVPYVDPVMVLVTCVVFLPAPLRMVRHTGVELLEGAPPPEVRRPVEDAVAAVRAQFGLDEPTVLMTKVGPKLYVEVDAHVSPEVTVAQEHEVRTALEARLSDLPYDVWLNLELLPRTAR